jgi:FAD:protein FMN transferase
MAQVAHNSRLAALLTCVALLGALPRIVHAEWYKRTDAIMGTRIFVELWDTDEARGQAAIDAVMTEMRRIDDLMSHYKPESELSKINQHAADAPVQVDK